MMPHSKIYDLILSSKKDGKKLFAVLIDPDKTNFQGIEKLLDNCCNHQVDLIFVGGSLISDINRFYESVRLVKKLSKVPVVLFPGSPSQITNEADAILLLSLISGRNPELLIGQHVASAPALKASRLEILPTGYILIDGGKPTSVSYVSNTQPIPAGKTDIAYCTALAGELLGLKLIYLEAGSGAINPVSTATIKTVSANISVPLIVGGGINTSEKALAACRSGADIVVIGNALEKETTLLKEISEAIHAN